MRELSDEHPYMPHLHPHLLRRTFATNLRVQGTEIADIQNVLGHEKVDTTMIYAHAKLRLLIEASAPGQLYYSASAAGCFSNDHRLSICPLRSFLI